MLHKEFVFLLPEGFGFSENGSFSEWVWHRLFPHLAWWPHCSLLTWFTSHLTGNGEKKGGRVQFPSSKEAAFCQCQVQWMASVFGGTEEFWTNSPVSHKRSLGGRQGERAMLGYSWYCFRNFICAELDILLVTLLGSPRSTKIFGCWSQYGETIFKSVLSYIMPPAQHTLLQTSANGSVLNFYNQARIGCVEISKQSPANQWSLPWSLWWSRVAVSLLECSSNRTASGIILLEQEQRICTTILWQFGLERVCQPKPCMVQWQRWIKSNMHTSGKPLQPGTLQSSGKLERLIRSCPQVTELWLWDIWAVLTLLWGCTRLILLRALGVAQACAWHCQDWRSLLQAGSCLCSHNCALKHWLLIGAQGQSPKMKTLWFDLFWGKALSTAVSVQFQRNSVFKTWWNKALILH